MNSNETPYAELAIESTSPQQTTQIAGALGSLLRPGDTVLLTGDLGAGKTHFAQGVLVGLGSGSNAVSPTFNIILEYDDGRIPLAHMDLYRLEDASELEDIDFYSIAEEDSPFACLVEWANLFPDEMPEDSLIVDIARSDAMPDSARRLNFTACGPRSGELLKGVVAILGDGRS